MALIFNLVCLQTPLNEKADVMEIQEKQNKQAVASGKRNIPSRKVCRKEQKGPPFMSKPEVIVFKVPHHHQRCSVRVMYLRLLNMSFTCFYCSAAVVCCRISKSEKPIRRKSSWQTSVTSPTTSSLLGFLLSCRILSQSSKILTGWKWGRSVDGRRVLCMWAMKQTKTPRVKVPLLRSSLRDSVLVTCPFKLSV